LNLYRETANDIHHSVVETFYSQVKRMGMKATIKKENDLVPEDIKGRDLCISIGNYHKNLNITGGDSTYLKSAGIIDNPS
jgi:hypothetical protein